MIRPNAAAVCVGLAIAIVSCAPAGTRSPSGSLSAPATSDEGSRSRTLELAVKLEPVGMAPKLQVGQNNTRTARRLVSAYEAIKDDRGMPHPYLAEALPQLGT